MSSFNYILDNHEEKYNLVMKVNLKSSLSPLLLKTAPTSKEYFINCHYLGIMELEQLILLLSFIYLRDSGITYSLVL